MDTFISAKDTQGHLIQKYQFKVISNRDKSDSETPKEYKFQQQSPEEDTTIQQSPPQEQDLDQAQQKMAKNTVNGSSVDLLLKKTDELSSSLLSMQKSYESQQEEFKKMIEQAKDEAYKKGQLEAQQQMSQEQKEQDEQEVGKFIAAIDRLDKTTKKFQEKIDTIEEDLISTSIDIAKEVINKEVSKSSKDIALNLAYLLLDDIKDASKITLKVSPRDYTHIKQRMQSDNVEVVSDNSINDGGVMVMSDAGNIDGDLMQRFEKVKEMVFR